MADSVEKIARRLLRLEREVAHLGRTPQLAYSSVEDGAIEVNDAEGNTTMVVGQQFDGTASAAVVGGPVPPTPSSPVVTPGLQNLRVYWDGTFAGGELAPMNFARVTIHAVPTSQFVEPDPIDSRWIVGMITSATGGEVTAALPIEDHTVFLVAWSLAGKFSAASDAGFGMPEAAPSSGPGQTFSTSEPTTTAGFPEGHAWWQVVDDEVLGFWRLTAGEWVPTEIVTAEALRANNAFIDALQTVDLSTVNLEAINMQGGSIYIAQSTSAEYPRAFSGTTLPDGWTASQTVTGAYVAPDPSVINTGLPAGGDGSALFFDTGAAGQTDGSTTLKVVPGYDVQNFELLMKYQLDLPGDEPLPPTLFRIGMCVTGDDLYRLDITGTTVSFHEVINGSTTAAAISQDLPWIDSSWCWVRVRKAGGSVALAAWLDGDVEPALTAAPLSTSLPAGNVEIAVSTSTFLGPSDGQRVWVDQFDVTTLTTGFQVNPDGTGDWPHLRELLLESFQSGTVSSGTFAAVNTEKTINVTFPVPFETIPDVQLTLETTHSPVNLYPPVKRNVTTTGFTIAVARSNALGSVDISWSASVS